MVQHVSLTFSRYLSTISRPQELHTDFPCGVATAGADEDEDEDREDGEVQSSSKSGPEEPCQKKQSDQGAASRISLHLTQWLCP